MKVFWGDLHNHCGITYGIGSLKNALKAARYQLDFASVTPHAFWPDMPERSPETDFLIDFHTRGFEKIAKNWDGVKAELDAANEPGHFTTFYSFEMHSSRWGDHHFVSPDRSLRIERFATPGEVLAANSARTIAIPHHIGYTPGYRGIDWNGFREEISPVVEVVSKHGCAMHDNSGFPYYHDMGPFDPRNSVWRGLHMGKRFGFVGSTDHHAGFPGSYGDGRVAVLAEENTREALFDAILRRRTYAVTGAKILCDFQVNGARMGAEIPASGEYRIDWGVEASAPIDRVVIFRNLKPVQIIDGWQLPDTGGRYKLCLELGWGDNIDEAYPWDVRLNVEQGRILGCEPCLRGRSVLSPKQGVSESDEINRARFHLNWGEDELCFACETYRNNSTLSPSTAMLIVEIQGSADTLTRWEINGRRIECTVAQLLECGITAHERPYNSQAFKLHTAAPLGKYAVSGSLLLPEDGAHLYHMEVRQFDGNAAYVSPVFIDR